MSDVDPRDLASTATLIRRYQGGDDEARRALVERTLPALRRWARGRLPSYARDLADTDDLVQTTLLKTVRSLGSFDPDRGSFLAYMRQVLLNTVRDEIRRQVRTPRSTPVGDATGEIGEIPVAGPRPAVLASYERALDSLPETSREAVILRVEFGMTFPEIAVELGLPSANAARMRVTRAMAEVAEAMPR